MRRTRTKQEIVGTFISDRNNPEWLFFNLWRERLVCEDNKETGTRYYELVCRTQEALRLKDYGEMDRLIDKLADNVDL